jgi:hypothetical protein
VPGRTDRCSCPVAPNGLVSLSAERDILTNAAAPVVPTSLVVKLVATVPSGGTCPGSGTAISPVNLATSLNAWGTKLHVEGSDAQVTETFFCPPHSVPVSCRD